MMTDRESRMDGPGPAAGGGIGGAAAFIIPELKAAIAEQAERLSRSMEDVERAVEEIGDKVGGDEELSDWEQAALNGGDDDFDDFEEDFEDIEDEDMEDLEDFNGDLDGEFDGDGFDLGGDVGMEAAVAADFGGGF